MKNSIKPLSRLLMILAAGLLIASIFVPIWQIDLDAPQYPEGLCLKIYANNIAGDVDIINGLNHYIGMKTLHAKDFIEFSVLVYIIGFYAAISLAVALTGKKKFLYTVFVLFIVFGVVAMADFWRWEYNYGHNLDPNAAIVVPGMAYQPPLIGFKQLLNFGAFSIPDLGGWFMLGSGILMLFAVLVESGILARFIKPKTAVYSLGFIGFAFMNACTGAGPQAIAYHSDACDDCKMTIADPHFACELITKKGRTYKFDDVLCMTNYIKKNKEKTEGAALYVCDYLSPHALLPAGELSFIRSKSISSPMRGNTAAFMNKDSLNFYHQKYTAEFVHLTDINP